MAKKTQGTDTKQHDIAAPPENMPLDKSIVRYKSLHKTSPFCG